MKNSHQTDKGTLKDIAVIGGGVIGNMTGWYLAKEGHSVEVIDPSFSRKIERSGLVNGSTASLGVLMGNIFKRDRGRAWNLRQRSMHLWKEWISELSSKEYPVQIHKPLIKIASSEEESYLMNNLIKIRNELKLEKLSIDYCQGLNPPWPDAKFGGIISHEDGYINTINLQKNLFKLLDTYKVKKTPTLVCKIEKKLSRGNKIQWILHLSNKQILKKDIIILCASVTTESLLQPLGYKIPIERLDGEAMVIRAKIDIKSWCSWPSVLINKGINLIPQSSNEIIIGATLESCQKNSTVKECYKEEMMKACPEWIQKGDVINTWRGVRARPKAEGAPILKELETGLIVATGHYRNGILLAPVTAEWVKEKIINIK